MAYEENKGIVPRNQQSIGQIQQAKARLAGGGSQVGPALRTYTPPPGLPSPSAAPAPQGIRGALAGPKPAPVSAVAAAAPSPTIYVNSAGVASRAVPVDAMTQAGIDRVKANIAAEKASMLKGGGTPPPSTPAAGGSGAFNAGKSAGAATAKAATGIRKSVNSKTGKGIGAMAAIDAGVTSYNTEAQDYYTRFGITPRNDGTVTGDLLPNLGVRALGFASDLGNSLTLGQAGRLYRDMQGDNSMPLPAMPLVEDPVIPAEGNGSGVGIRGNTNVGDRTVNNVTLKNGEGAVSVGGKSLSIRDGVVSGDDIGAPGRGTVSTVPSNADADAAKLGGIFSRYFNAGDLEGAMRTAVTPEQMAMLGKLEADTVARRDVATQNNINDARRQEIDQKITNEQRMRGFYEPDVASGGRRGRRGSAEAGIRDKTIAELMTQRGAIPGDQSLPKMETAADLQSKAADLQAAGIRNKKGQAELNQAQAMEQLQQQLAGASDETQARSIRDAILVMQGKNPSEGRIVTVDEQYIDPQTGLTNTMKVAYDATTGKKFGGSQQAGMAANGMKLVGTKGGKPVYEDANGNRFVDE